MLWIGENGSGIAGFDNAAFFKNDDAPAERGDDADVVRDEEQAHGFAEARKQVDNANTGREVEGADGSWLILDITAGRINGVEIAVWPDVRKLSTLAPPATIEDAHVVVPARRSQPDIASLEMNARLIAEADHDQRNFHFRLGKPKPARTIRVARDLLLDIDEKSQIAGLWLLNVPPCPTES